MYVISMLVLWENLILVIYAYLQLSVISMLVQDIIFGIYTYWQLSGMTAGGVAKRAAGTLPALLPSVTSSSHSEIPLFSQGI